MIQGRVDRKEGGGGGGEGGNGEEGNREGETGMVKRGGVEVLARARSGEGETGRVRLGGGNGEREGANGKGGDGGEGKGRTGKGRGERGRGQRGGREEGARGEGISQMDMMKCLGGMRLQSFLTLFTHAALGTPASLY